MLSLIQDVRATAGRWALCLAGCWMVVPSSAPGQEPRASAGPIRLIVRGDDFGNTHASNQALEPAFGDGIMTSASLLVAGPWFQETAALVRAHPEWHVGIHLTITSEWNHLRWGPVAPRSEVPTLVAPDGGFYIGGYFWPDPQLSEAHRPFWALGPPTAAQVDREIRAQVERARASGIRVEYLDCHMGMVCRRQLLPVLQALARELCLPIPEQGLLGEREVDVRWTVKTPEAGKQALEEMLRSLTPGLWRYVGHPAVDAPELRAVDSEWGPDVAAERSTTLAMWTDPDVRRLIAERGIELVSVADLWDYEKCAPRR